MGLMRWTCRPGGPVVQPLEGGGATGRRIIPNCSRGSRGSRSACSGWTRRPRRPGDCRNSLAGRWGDFLLADIQEFIDNPPGVVDASRAVLDREPTARGRPPGRGPLSQAPGAEPATARPSGGCPDPVGGNAGGIGSPDGWSEPDPEVYWLLSRAYLQEGRIRMPPAPGTFRLIRCREPAEARAEPLCGLRGLHPCHRPQDRAYQGTRHTRSFHHGPGLLDLPLPGQPLANPDDPKVTHTIAKGSEGRGPDPRRQSGLPDGRRIRIRDARTVCVDDRSG